MAERVRVLDLTDAAGVYATRLLADLGADVIRLERFRPREAARSSRYRFFNAGKRSVGVDLRHAEAQDVVARLSLKADAVVEGIEPVVDPVEPLYMRCRGANARLTWIAVRAFAPAAAGAPARSAEIVRYALSGLMSITGLPDGTPMLAGGGFPDAIVSVYAAIACQLGCRLARQTGEGRLIVISAHEALATLMQQGLFEAALSGRVVKRAGNRHAHIAMAGALPCRDGSVVISANERDMWRALVDMVGDERLSDPALADERVRMERQAEIFEVLAGWTRRFPKAELAEAAQARHIPVAPVHDVEDLLRDPHLDSRRFFRDMQGERMPALLVPSGARPSAAPVPGGHTRDVLVEAGFTHDEIGRLASSGVIASVVEAGSGATA